MIQNDQSPAYEPIGTITLLSEGFVVSIRGKTVACKNAVELGKQVSRLCKTIRMPKRPAAPEAQPSWQPVLPQMPYQSTQPAMTSAAPTAASSQPLWSEATEKAKIAREIDNLRALCEARASGMLSLPAFYSNVSTLCPDIADDAVQLMLAQAEDAYMNRQATGQSAQCQCSGGLCQQVVSIPNTANFCRACQAGEHYHPQPGHEIREETTPSVRYIPADQVADEMVGFQSAEQAEIEESEDGSAAAFDRDSPTGA